MMKILLAIVCFIYIQNTLAYGPYPVPVPKGGRLAVHGWLILPYDQETPTDPTTPIGAYFVHHTPEFWFDSPHNFQLILGGTLTPLSVAENQTFVIDIPYPPQSELLVDEYTFTPPPPFSLNDLLTGRIEQLVGVVYNGSFDTLYERIPISLATLDINEMPTAIWLNISSEIPNYEELRYFSYPRSRSILTSGMADFYMSHEIHSMNTNPDFDQVIHTQIDLDSCTCKSCSSVSDMFQFLSKPGIEWEIPSIKNSLENRLMPVQKVVASTTEQMIQCNAIVLEEIHCVVGPAFANRC